MRQWDLLPQKGLEEGVLDVCLFGKHNLDDSASYSFPTCSGGMLPEDLCHAMLMQPAKEEEPVTERERETWGR